MQAYNERVKYPTTEEDGLAAVRAKEKELLRQIDEEHQRFSREWDEHLALRDETWYKTWTREKSDEWYENRPEEPDVGPIYSRIDQLWKDWSWTRLNPVMQPLYVRGILTWVPDYSV